jgi:adenylate cyclase
MQPGTLAGHFNPDADRDGVTRRVHLLTEYDGQYYEALSLAMVRTYLGQPAIEPVYEQSALKNYAPLEWLKVGPLRIPVDDTVSALVPYRGRQGSFAYVSAADVVAGRVAPEVIAGRMVLVGTTAPGLKDLRVTPVDPVYPGVEVHANMILGMMDRTMPAQPTYLQGGEMLQLVVVGVLLMVALARLNPLPGTVVTVLLLGLTVAFNLLLWTRYRLAMPLGSTVLMIVLLYGISMAYGYFFESRNKKQMASLFGQYVPPELVEKMSEEPEKYSMEGKSQELTVLFSDVRDFTTISESMDPKDLSRFMNEFLTVLSDIIRTRYLGTIDKYMGDCVMAFWGAPLHDPEHACHAVLAGLDMQRAIRELGPRLKARGWPEIRIGVGVNTGRMTVGDMGSRIRKAYTVMGDAVNLASRLESLTKHYGVGILVGERTREAVRDVVMFREIDRVRVKGKDEPVTIYEPIARIQDVSDATRKVLELFAQALRHYRNQDWDLAELQLLNLQQLEPDCALYGVYLARIAHFRKNPPPADWQGVFDFDTK